MSAKPKEQTGTDIFDGIDVLGALMSLAKSKKRFYRTLCLATIDALDELDEIEWRRQAKADRFTRKGDRRPIAAVEKGKATVKKRRCQRSAKRSSERRLSQRAEHGDRLFPREMSATAILLLALQPGRWYLRNEVRAACPELPSGSLEALLGRKLVQAGGTLERTPNPSWDGKRGTLREKGADSSPQRLSPWRYRLSAVGEAARNDVLANPEPWTIRALRQASLERARAVPQPHSWAAFGGRPVSMASKAPADPLL